MKIEKLVDVVRRHPILHDENKRSDCKKRDKLWETIIAKHMGAGI